MKYYDIIDMKSLQMKERTVLENIYLILNQEWLYQEEKETKQMVAMFEDSEKIIDKFMSMKEIDIKNKKTLEILDLTEEEKRTGMIEKPEEWIEEISVTEVIRAMNAPEIDGMLGCSEEDYPIECEKVKILVKFVLKMAVYRFCTVHFPKIVEKSSGNRFINEKKIEVLKSELEEWERLFWKNTDICGVHGEDISSKRRKLISCYTYTGSWHGDWYLWDCIEGAYRDEGTFERVKKLRLNYREEDTFKIDGLSSNKNHKEIAEIENMRKLLDFMEKQLNGELTEEDSGKLKEYVAEWKIDIENLTKMIDKLS